jgi:hypothetical protein
VLLSSLREVYSVYTHFSHNYEKNLMVMLVLYKNVMYGIHSPVCHV